MVRGLCWSLVAVVVVGLACETVWAVPPNYGTAPPTPRGDAILGGIYSVSLRMARAGKAPVNVVDLDGTLFETGSRHKRIMLEFGLRHRRRFPGLADAVRAWVPMEQPYLVEDTFDGLGLTREADRKAAKQFWKDRFFTNEYLEADGPLPGAVRYVKALHRAGSTIVYLTGRKTSQQGPGSLKVLAMNGFPVPPERCALLMNPRTSLHDTTYKGSREVHDQIAAFGEVVGIFDNEPGNVNVLQRSFPDAMTVYLDTDHSPDAPPVDTGIPWIRNFRWSALER